MRSAASLFAVLSSFLFIVLPVAAQENWPQFRGADSMGI